MGEAQEVLKALEKEKASSCNKLKAEILDCCEITAEMYRQKLCSLSVALVSNFNPLGCGYLMVTSTIKDGR